MPLRTLHFNRLSHSYTVAPLWQPSLHAASSAVLVFLGMCGSVLWVLFRSATAAQAARVFGLKLPSMSAGLIESLAEWHRRVFWAQNLNP